MNPYCIVIDRNYRAISPRVDPANDVPSFELIISPVKKQPPVGKTTNRKRNLPDVSIAAVTDVSANEALGTAECIDVKTVVKATCDTNEVQPVDLMHVLPVKKDTWIMIENLKAIEEEEPSSSDSDNCVLKEFQYIESCAVDLGGDAISVDAGKVSGKASIQEATIEGHIEGIQPPTQVVETQNAACPRKVNISGVSGSSLPLIFCIHVRSGPILLGGLFTLQKIL